MSARGRQSWVATLLAIACGAYGGAVVADDEELPALELLEYLGSWEESDEDWVLLNELGEMPAAVKESGHEDAEPTVEESTESEHGS